MIPKINPKNLRSYCKNKTKQREKASKNGFIFKADFKTSKVTVKKGHF